jgi:plastocyanin
MRRVTFLIALGILAVAFIAACGGDDEGEDDPAPTNTAVATAELQTTIENVKFESPLQVKPGTEVIWTNKDALSHNVVSKDDDFESGNLGKDETYSHIFTEPGEYEYTCTLHPGMDGVVEVE